MEDGTTFHFVTQGIESALEQARAAAGEKDVSIGGSASVIQQYLAAGLLDELLVSVVPIFLGGGALPFDNLGEPKPGFDRCRLSRRPESPTSGTSPPRDRASASWRGAEGDTGGGGHSR